jgi:hypothetical protein
MCFILMRTARGWLLAPGWARQSILPSSAREGGGGITCFSPKDNGTGDWLLAPDWARYSVQPSCTCVKQRAITLTCISCAGLLLQMQ